MFKMNQNTFGFKTHSKRLKFEIGAMIIFFIFYCLFVGGQIVLEKTVKTEVTMIEILNINPINKGALLASCDVHIKPWKMTLMDIKIFEKGATRWITLPSKQYENDSGEIKYTELVTFDNDAIKKRFRDQIMQAIDKFLQGNPDCKPESVIKEDEELPF